MQHIVLARYQKLQYSAVNNYTHSNTCFILILLVSVCRAIVVALSLLATVEIVDLFFAFSRVLQFFSFYRKYFSFAF